MAREVEQELEEILGQVKGGGKAAGAKELKMLKDRNRLLLDVSSGLANRLLLREDADSFTGFTTGLVLMTLRRV